MIFADLSADDLALIIVTGCSIVAVVAVLFALQRILVAVRRVAKQPAPEIEWHPCFDCGTGVIFFVIVCIACPRVSRPRVPAGRVCR